METLSCWVLKRVLYGGDLGLENIPKACFLQDATEKTQCVIDVEKPCVPSVRAIIAEQSDVPVYQSPVAI